MAILRMLRSPCSEQHSSDASGLVSKSHSSWLPSDWLAWARLRVVVAWVTYTWLLPSREELMLGRERE